MSSRTGHLNDAHRSPWASTGEPEVVHGDELAPILQRFCRRWEAERPNGAHGGHKYGGFIGPHQYLANETGINIRQIGAYVSGSRKYVGLGKADALLQAIGGPETINDLHVIPNPNWSQERWHTYMSERGCV